MEPSTGKKRAATPIQKEESKKRMLTNARPKGSTAAAPKETPSKNTPARARPKGSAAAAPKEAPSKNTRTQTNTALEEALPVRHNRPGWVKTEGRETLLAGYLGFQNVEELRRFIISWPILSLWPIFDNDAKKMQKKGVFRLADEQWDNLSSISTGESENFAIPEDASPDFTKVQKQKRVAWVCIHLAHVIESKYAVWSDAQNIKETKRLQDKFTKENPDFAFPSADAQTLIPRVSITYHPEFGETRLELLNRSWELFRYFSYLFHTANIWSRVESVEAMKKAAVVQDANLPPWMRAPKEVVKSALGPHKTHETYHPIKITAYWHRNKRFPGREDLELALTEAEEKGLAIPPEVLKVNKETRAFTTVAMFRDYIRAIYNCRQLGLNLYSVRMRYTSSIDDEEFSHDILREEWDSIRSTMMDPLISDFRLDIILRATQSEDDDTYEEGIMPKGIEEALMAEAQGPQQLDETVVSRILSSSQKDTTLQPKKCDSLDDQILWYSGHDVNTASGRREWQQQLVAKLLAGVKFDIPEIVKMPKTLLATKEEKASVEQAQQQAHRDSEDQVIHSDNDYSVLQRAFSGNQDRCGPPLDLCVSLLACELHGNEGRYRSLLLSNHTKSTFYNYQITGAIGIVLKLLGKIDATKLFEACPDVGWTLEQLDLAEHAATKLEDLQTHGAILADGTGFGKTKQCLLAALIFSILSTENMPMLLLVPAPLVSQWLQEVRRDWDGLVPILSYQDPVLKEQMLGSRLSVQQMWNLSFPQNLRYILDKTNPDARKTLIITSYETHIRRTSWVITKKDGEYWTTRHDNRFGLVIADEAHRVKNKQTAIASILKMQRPRALIFATATPMFNSIRDLIGLIDLIGVRGLQSLSQACEDPTTNGKYHQLRAKSSKNKKLELKEMPKASPLRLMLLDPTVLNDLIRHRETLPMEADYFGFGLDLIAIQRSPGSCLPNSSGPSIAMKDMFKSITFKTADMELSTEERAVYQAFHAKAAEEYIVETAIERTANPGQKVKAKFIAATKSLRKLAIANFSTTLAILNAKLELGDSNTHVATLHEWRQENIAAEWVYMVTKEDTDCAIHSADDLMKFLVHGSPRLRLIFQQLLDRKVFEEVDKDRFGHHQKILIVDSCPLNAWYAEVVLRAALVDARTLHSALEPSERDTLVNEFNDPQSTLRVLITTYDMGSVGLNLHHACNRVILTSPGRSWAQEAQAAGRALRITSEFPLTVVRVATANSHDQFRDSKQAEKACLQLAINRQDLGFRSIMLKELKSIQSDVNLCHESQDGKVLLERKFAAEQQMDQDLAQYLMDRQSERSDERLARKETNTRKNPVFNYVVVTDDDDDEHSAPEDKETVSDAGENAPDAEENAPNAEENAPNAEENASDAEYIASDAEENASDAEYIASDAEENASDDEYNASDDEESIDLDDTDELAFAQREEIERARDIERWHNAKTWERFAERTQPSDQVRHQMALLSLPYDKEWQMEDLDNPKVFMIALRLVYNRIRGVKVLHLGTSIHIKYDELSTSQLGRLGELFERDGEQQDEEFKEQIRARIARPAR